MEKILLFTAAGLTFLWGFSHLFPTKNIVKGFGEISPDNRNIITMEWINEGATLIFIGILTAAVTVVDTESWLARIVFIIIAVFLIALAIISLFTGFRVKFFAFKLCPVIFTASAILIIAGVLL